MADYVIQRGDTLSAIAQRLGTTVQALAQANGISNPDLIRAGAVLRVPDAPGAQQAARPANAPAPTTGAMPRPRPQQVAALDPMAAPVPQPNPSRPSPPLPPQNPVRPGVAGPPLDRGAPMQAGGGPAGYQPAGWSPVPAPGPVPTTQEWTTRGRNPGPIGAPDGDPAFNDIYGTPAASGPSPGPRQPPRPDMWQGAQGNAYDRHRQLTLNDVPDPATLSYQQMREFETRWLGSGRKIAELGPVWAEASYLRSQQHDLEREMALREAEQIAMREQAGFRAAHGTDPRMRETQPFGPPGQIGEGEYLPQEMIQLGQLGANMQGAPRANTMLGSLASQPPPLGANVIGGQYVQPQNAATLGQLATRPWPFAPPMPYLGV